MASPAYESSAHCARLALVEAALAALLVAAQRDESSDAPDAVTAELTPAGLDVTYWLQGVAVGGEGL